MGQSVEQAETVCVSKKQTLPMRGTFDTCGKETSRLPEEGRLLKIG